MKLLKETFDEISSQENYRYNEYELEDHFANILYRPKTKGKLTEEEFTALKTQLSNIEPLKDDIIVIIYYPGKDRCNQTNANSRWNIFDNDYKKSLDKLTSNHHFWVYKNDEDLNYYYPNKVSWQKDNNQIIEMFFFKIHYPCFSSAVIDSNGNYILNLGEFGKQHILQSVKELKK